MSILDAYPRRSKGKKCWQLAVSFVCWELVAFCYFRATLLPELPNTGYGLFQLFALPSGGR